MRQQGRDRVEKDEIKHFLLFFMCLSCCQFEDKVLDQGYPQSELNINLHLAALLFYEAIIKNTVTLFFMGMVQTK